MSLSAPRLPTIQDTLPPDLHIERLLCRASHRNPLAPARRVRRRLMSRVTLFNSRPRQRLLAIEQLRVCPFALAHHFNLGATSPAFENWFALLKECGTRFFSILAGKGDTDIRQLVA
jgi:hypothetical protein